MSIGFSSGRFTSDEDDIYYEIAGDGNEVVVLCHGLGGNHAVWYQQVPVFARTFRVVTWDQRRFGLSSDRGGQAGPEIAAVDLGVLLDHLGIERAHLIGQSMGGWVVMGFALRSPERVRSLVITDSPAGVYSDAVLQLLAARKLEPVEQAVGVHAAIGARLRATDPAKAFLYQQIGSFRGDPDETDAIMRRTGATRYAVDDVAKLRIPTLLVTGAQDELIPPAVTHAVADVIDGAQVVEIADAGHSPYFEQPDAWNTAVLDFLGSVTRG